MPEKANPIRSFFSSVKLTIVLLILIALMAVVGTFIPQQEGAAEFLGRFSPAVAGLLERLQIADIYHSVIFLALMVLLFLNLIVCSLSRFPSSLKKMQVTGFPVAEDLFPSLDDDQPLFVTADQDAVVRKLEVIVKKKFGAVAKEETKQGIFLFAQKGRFSYLGVYVVHLSILTIVLGAVVGSLFGFEAYVSIDQGKTVREVELKGGRGIKPLDFSVRCDRFFVDFYENGSPKTYRSDLSFIKDGRIAHQGALLVNHPLTFENIRFYQSSYGTSPGRKAFLSYTKGGVRQRELALMEGDVFELSESKANGTVLRVEENMMEMGPAVKLNIASPQGDIQFWVFSHIAEIKRVNPGLLNEIPLFNPGLFKPYEFFLTRVEQKFSTGLQVVRDPGLPLVAGGGILMIVGLIMTFWISHRRFWIWFYTDGGKTFIHITGKSNRNREAFEQEMHSLHTTIKEIIPT